MLGPLGLMVMLLLRPRLGVHRIPSGDSHDATAPTVVRLLLYHDHCLGAGHTSEMTFSSFQKTPFELRMC